MPKIKNRDDFVKQLKLFLGEDTVHLQTTTKIEIEEIEDKGKGSIYLKFKNFKSSKKRFLVKIDHIQRHGSAGVCELSLKICDGIVFYVNLESFEIDIYLCELKTTATTDAIEKAQLQLSSALTLINNLGFHRCNFNINITSVIGYKNNYGYEEGLELRDIVDPKNERKYYLHDAWLNNKNEIPIVNIFCEYSLEKFQKVKFDETLEINI